MPWEYAENEEVKAPWILYLINGGRWLVSALCYDCFTSWGRAFDTHRTNSGGPQSYSRHGRNEKNMFSSQETQSSTL